MKRSQSMRKLLLTAGISLALASPAVAQTYQNGIVFDALFGAPGTYTVSVPTNISRVYVDACSGGGAGSGTTGGGGFGGGGGSGAACLAHYPLPVTPGQTLTIVVAPAAFRLPRPTAALLPSAAQGLSFPLLPRGLAPISPARQRPERAPLSLAPRAARHREISARPMCSDRLSAALVAVPVYPIARLLPAARVSFRAALATTTPTPAAAPAAPPHSALVRIA